MYKVIASLLLVISCSGIPASSQEAVETAAVTTVRSEGALSLASPGLCAPLSVSPDDWPGVIRAATDLQNDLYRVTGTMPELSNKYKGSAFRDADCGRHHRQEHAD